MSRFEEIAQVTEGAKQQRAKLVGSALRARAVPILVIAVAALTLLQFTARDAPENVDSTAERVAQLG